MMKDNNRSYRIQRGFFPFLSKFIVLYLIGVLGTSLYQVIANSEKYNLSLLGWVIGFLVVDGFFIIILLFFAFLFPDIKISDEGVYYRILFFLKRRILWEEIDFIKEISRPKILKGYYAISINRKGFRHLFSYKGLFFETLIGNGIANFSPAILVSSKTLSEDEFDHIKREQGAWKRGI